METSQPLGYWLKHLHNLLETQFARILSDLGTDRRQWQLLNTLARGPQSTADLKQALAPFWTDDGPTLPASLATLTEHGWIATSGDTVTLTPAGTTAHADLTARVNQARTVVLQGLTPQQYEDTTRILAVMSANVAASLETREANSGA